MTTKLSILTSLVLLLSVGILFSQQPQPESNNSSGSNDLSATGGLSDPHEILRDATAELKKRKTIEVKIRMQTELHGHKLFGSGMYQQQGGGPAARMRLEMQLGPADQSSTLLNVCDGQYLWMRKQLPKLKKLQRVDMKKIIDAMKKKNTHFATSPNALMFGPSIKVGGFSYMLQSLDQHFKFEKVEVRRLKTIDVYVLSGKIKKKSLAKILPKQAEAILSDKEFDASKIPAHVPQRVVIYLGRDDLFPYRVEYIRKVFEKVNGKPTKNKVDKIYMNVQMYQRKFDMPISPNQFIYKPGNQEIWDLTEKYLIKFDLK